MFLTPSHATAFIRYHHHFTMSSTFFFFLLYILLYIQLYIISILVAYTSSRLSIIKPSFSI